jgi:hypothetical protein
VVLHGCETWSLILREEPRLRAFENRVLRRIFEPKRDEVTEEWKKLHHEELHYLRSSSSIIRNMKSRRMRWVGHVARMGEKKNAYRFLVEKPEGNRTLRRPRRKWIYNINMDLSEIGLRGVEWLGLAQDRYSWIALVIAAITLRAL